MKKMYVEPMGGLGNRMNCIISAIVDSKKYGFDLTVIWNINQGCAIKFTDLMQSIENVKFIELSKMGFRRITGGLTAVSYLYTKYLMKCCEMLADESCVQKNFVEHPENKEDIYKADTIYLKASCGWVDREAFDMVRDLFIPQVIYENKLEEIFKDVNKEKLYGFHIRRTDHVISIQNCPTELFVNKMDELIRADQNVKFYLATDDMELEQKLYKKYKNNMVKRQPFSQKVKRDTKEGMMDAFVDLLCLASCKTIYGSDSTFSTLASYLGKNELLVLTK